MITGTTGKN